MALSLPNSAALVLLSAVAIATWYWGRQPPPAPLRQRSDDAALPGYYLHGARLTGTDDAGRIAYRIRADSLEEQTQSEELQMTGVHVEYTPVDETAWSIRAARATAPKDGSRLDLAGLVELRSAPTDGSKPMTVTTESMRFEPHNSSAESDVAVDLKIGDWHVAAVGFRAHLKDDKVELESNVHGKFAR